MSPKTVLDYVKTPSLTQLHESLTCAFSVPKLVLSLKHKDEKNIVGYRVFNQSVNLKKKNADHLSYLNFFFFKVSSAMRKASILLDSQVVI